MKALALQNGDLVVGQGGFATVNGVTKVRQDLGIAMREPLRSDRFHPGWGSALPSYIGMPISQQIGSMVEAEVYRLVRNYMTVKGNEIQQDYLRGSSPHFTMDEVVSNITDVKVSWSMDRIYVQVSLQTAGGSQVTLVNTVGI